MKVALLLIALASASPDDAGSLDSGYAYACGFTDGYFKAIRDLEPGAKLPAQDKACAEYRDNAAAKGFKP